MLTIKYSLIMKYHSLINLIIGNHKQCYPNRLKINDFLCIIPDTQFYLYVFNINNHIKILIFNNNAIGCEYKLQPIAVNIEYCFKVYLFIIFLWNIQNPDEKH